MNGTDRSRTAEAVRQSEARALRYAKARAIAADVVTERLRLEMQARGIPVAEVGRVMGLSDTPTRSRFNGRTEMSAAELIGLCLAFELGDVLVEMFADVEEIVS